MFHPVIMLTDTETNRFHPLVFRVAPMPGGADDNAVMQRYRSLGHHTEGFDTEDQAMVHVRENRKNGWLWTGVSRDWDPADGLPLSVEWFDTRKLLEKNPDSTEAATS